ncbi:MAG: ErfK/YbiS/YcfS/YnhG family protein [Gemmatimonadetes bacterium]|nr:ErfK/YbiS/YcfS/YnhG family protein [Gemmatimonadota bacterium]
MQHIRRPYTFGIVRRRRGAAILLGITAALASAAVQRGAAAEPDPPIVRLEASLGGRTLTIRDGDSVVATYPIAIGKDSKPTPPGRYLIRKIIWNPAWIPPDEKWAAGKKPQAPGAKANPMKLVKIFFKEPDYYIHGTGDVESLGDAASHGCLRMEPDDAYRVARYVMEHGGEPRDESWFWRVLHFRSETKTVMLDRPVPITIE